VPEADRQGRSPPVRRRASERGPLDASQRFILKIPARGSLTIEIMLISDQFAAVGRVLAAYSWLQQNVIEALGFLMERDADTTFVIADSLTVPDRVRVSFRLLGQHAGRNKISTSAFQGFDATLRTAFDLLTVTLVLPGLTFDVNAYAENRNDDWSGFNLSIDKSEIELIASAYLNAAAGLLGAKCVYQLEFEQRSGRVNTMGQSAEQ
jgi:hypothetical protein